MALDQHGFEEEVLGFVCDDYEASSTITKDMSRELGRSITEDEVRSALLSLAAKGIVLAFRAEQTHGMVPISADAAKLEVDPWFIAKPEHGGRAI